MYNDENKSIKGRRKEISSQWLGIPQFYSCDVSSSILYMDHSCWKLRNELVYMTYFIFQVIRRRIVLPASLENETPPLKVTLSKRNRKDGM